MIRRLAVCVAAVVASAGLIGCGGFPLPSNDAPNSLSGEAFLTAPLEDATVALETAAGEPLAAASGGATFKGQFIAPLDSSSLPSSGDIASWATYLPLTVKVAGGTAGGHPFAGTLLGYAESLAPRHSLHVNIFTTLVVKYQRAAGATLGQAEAAVKNFLHIPAEVDLANKLHDPNFWKYLNPARFMARAETHGGFDAFTDQVVSSMVQTRSAGVSLTGGEEGGSIASAAASFLKDGIGEGLLAYGTEQAMGWILSAFGYQDPTDKELGQIKDQLTQMNTTLTDIQTEITTLTNQMSQLLALVQLSWDSLTSEIDSLNMSDDENAIRNQYGNMLSAFSATSPGLCLPAGLTQASTFAEQIMGSYSGINYDIDQNISNIYYNLTGQNDGSAGALYALTSKLVDQANGGQDLFNCYNALENYFGQITGIQAQGLDLMIEAMHQTQNPPNSSLLTTFPGGASQYYDKFNGQLSDEVEMFLYCVDRLVMAKVDVRSDLVQKVAYLPPEAAEIYSRADFIAAKLSTVQPSGLVIRLIGDPVTVSDWITNNKVQVNGQNPTVVAVNGNNTNNYSPMLPTSTPSGVNYYLEWTANGNTYTFQKETEVSIVKLNYPAVAAGSFGLSLPDATQNQTVTVSMYNDDFQPASATDTDIVAYGSAVCYARVLPTWQAGSASKTRDSDNQFNASWTPDPQDIKMTLTTYPNELEWWAACPVTYAGQLLCTINNGTQNSLPVVLSWNGTRKTTATWKPSAAKPNFTGQQSLTCQTTQTSTDSAPASNLTLSVTLASGTNTVVTYAAQQAVNSGSLFNNGLEYGDSLNTVAQMTTLEIIPQQ